MYTFQAFYNQRHYCANLIRSSQKSYHNNLIQENKEDYKTLFNLTNSLLGKSDKLPLPPTRDLKSLAEDFIVSFGYKVDMIMKKIQEDVDQHKSILIESESQTTSIFDQFQPGDVSEVITLVQRTPKKMCELDPLPSKVLLKHLNTMAPFSQISLMSC